MTERRACHLGVCACWHASMAQARWIMHDESKRASSAFRTCDAVGRRVRNGKDVWRLILCIDSHQHMAMLHLVSLGDANVNAIIHHTGRRANPFRSYILGMRNFSSANGAIENLQTDRQARFRESRMLMPGMPARFALMV